MGPRINLAWPALVVLLCLASCSSFESEYEKGIYDYEPLYCYQTLGGVDCHRQPHHRDAARLVNYYGPAPSKYKPPKSPKESSLRAPPELKVPADDGVELRAAADTAPNGGEHPESTSEAAAEAKSDWKEWLPLVSVAFGALQVVAAFAL